MHSSTVLRKKFLDFFAQHNHSVVSSSSLIPADPSVLFTSAGMQQFKPYYLGEKSPYGPNAASCQKCFRTSDIEEVGNERNLTFFEMLGNFSFGGYQKKEAIKLAKEFLDSINVEIDYVTVFSGDKDVPKDQESVEIWNTFGFSEERGNLKFCGREDNFWGPTGEEGPCGPTTEIYCQGVEIWNLVFNQFYCHKDKRLTELPLFGVDTGMGLERLAKVCQNVPTVFETDLFLPVISEIKTGEEREKRIISDHVKSAVFLISEGVLPSNVERGYVLRRILRRAIRYGKLPDQSLAADFIIGLAKKIIEIYKDVYPETKTNESDILTVIQQETEKFEKTLVQGLKELKRLKKTEESEAGSLARVSAKDAFYIYQTFGFPLEMIQEELAKESLSVDENEFKKEFQKHQQVSRAGVKAKFGGVGKEVGHETARLHTATHLLHAALRKILGEHVKQMGSDITAQRLRFDFSHIQKMEKKEIEKVESLVNQKIKEDLDVRKEEMEYKEALVAGALAFFKEKYPERVTVYSIGDFSKEICAGPHVQKTSELGYLKIIKEESSGAGVRRIKAVLGNYEQ